MVNLYTGPTSDYDDRELLSFDQEAGMNVPIDSANGVNSSPNITSFPIKLDSLFSAPELGDEPMLPMKRFDQHLYNDIVLYRNAILNGQPSDLSDNYQRMFYFSAITITTIGFGDIVPLTTGARMAVTGEAIIGVILVGFFLNYLFSKE